MSRILLVHGAFNELWGPHEIAARWVPALRDGLWHHGVDIDESDVGVAFYGDLFRMDPDVGAMPDLDSLAESSGLIDLLDNALGDKAMATLADAVGNAAHQRLTDELGRFLAVGDVRRGVRERIDAVLGEDTELVISHSLGTVVSYVVLAGRTELSPALITMGSPLGRSMAFDQMKLAGDDGMGRWPGSVRCWTNIAAVGDPACAGKGLASRFGDRVTDHLVDNGHRAHDPEPYLNAAVTGAAVASALGLIDQAP